MEAAIILTALIIIGFAINYSHKEEKRYQDQMARCRERFLYQLGRETQKV